MNRLSLVLPAVCAMLSAGVPVKPTANPLTQPWKGRFGGLPAWSAYKPSDFPGAFDQGMEEARAAYKAIAANPQPATFENTLAAMERASRTLDRVGILFGVVTSTLNLGEVSKLEAAMAPKLAAFADEVLQDAGLFKRIEAVYQSPARAKLTPEQQRLTWLTYTTFVRGGAKLEPAQKARLGEVNQRLAALATTFNQNQLADETRHFTVIDRESDLGGLGEDLKAAAARAAAAKGLPGKWVIANTRSAVDPFLAYADNRALREKVWKLFVQRGDMGGETDNKAIVTEMLKLRYERARLLGYPTHAHWATELNMAGTPEKAVALMEAVWQPAVAQVRSDVADMQKLIDGEQGGFKLAPWDYRYYAEKLRKARYDLDMSEVKAFLQLDKMREAMFWAAGQLYGYTFHKLEGLEVQHPDVSVYEVKGPKGVHVGVWYFDPFARDGKRSGAWMNEYRTQNRLDKPVTPIVSNNSNFLKGAPGQPVLISWDDARTLFHEFGHALHGLSSNATYPTLAGTNTARDFVEFPSQINEHWFSTPEVLGRFARHHQTGQPIPQALVDKIHRATLFNEGFRTLEALASTVIDMKLHLAGGRTIDPAAFEQEELGRLGMPEEIVMRHRIPQFGHIFSGGVGGYEAGYYAYLWSDALTADAWEVFLEGKGPWDKAVAAKFKKEILSAGNTQDPAAAFRAFRGRDVDTSALMRKRGFLKK